MRKFKNLLVIVAALAAAVPAGAAGFDLASLGAADVPALAAGSAAVLPVPLARPAPEAPRAVQPGTGLLPAISDQGRVRAILDLIRKIHDGAPLPYSHDGIVFTNTEAVLPHQAPDFYKEYTLIPPPGSPMNITIGGKPYTVSPPIGKRGAERIIIGGGALVYYTMDHYRTFVQLTVTQ